MVNICPLYSQGNAAFKLENLEEGCTKDDMDVNNRLHVQRLFNKDCLGQAACTIPIDDTTVPSTCSELVGVKYDKTAESIAKWNNRDAENKTIALYALTECRTFALDSAAGGYSRESAAFYVVCMDLLIMFVFLLALWLVKYMLRIEMENYNIYSFEINEFAIMIDNLPDLDGEDYTLKELEVELVDLIDKEIKSQPQVLDALYDRRGLKDRQNLQIADIFITNNSLCLLENIFQMSTLMKEKTIAELHLDAAKTSGLSDRGIE